MQLLSSLVCYVLWYYNHSGDPRCSSDAHSLPFILYFHDMYWFFFFIKKIYIQYIAKWLLVHPNPLRISTVCTVSARREEWLSNLGKGPGLNFNPSPALPICNNQRASVAYLIKRLSMDLTGTVCWLFSSLVANRSNNKISRLENRHAVLKIGRCYVGVGPFRIHRSTVLTLIRLHRNREITLVN